jgi:GT2 family glycosyltransferase
MSAISQFVSVAIITRNRAPSLKRTLDAVTQLDYPSYEVLVVDNDSLDNTREVVDSYKANYIFSPARDGFSRTRQRAVAVARGEIIAWCDDDCVPERNWLTAFVNRFNEDAQLGMLGGKIINVNFPPSLQHKGTEVMTTNGVLKTVSDPYVAQFFANLNMAFRAELVKKVGGYDPFLRGGYEEVELALSLRKAGYKVEYEPNAVAHHYHNFVSFKRGRLYYGGQLMRIYTYLKHRQSIGSPGFLKRELRLMIFDCWRNFKLMLLGIKAFDFKKVNVSAIEIFNAIMARLSIPWILFRLSRKN